MGSGLISPIWHWYWLTSVFKFSSVKRSGVVSRRQGWFWVLFWWVFQGLGVIDKLRLGEVVGA